MCKAPKPPEKKEPKKPQFLRNRFLDEFAGDSGAVKSIRAGRSSLRQDLAPSGVTGTQSATLPLPTPTNGANIPPSSGNFLPPAPIAPIAPRGRGNRQLR